MNQRPGLRRSTKEFIFFIVPTTLISLLCFFPLFVLVYLLYRWSN